MNRLSIIIGVIFLVVVAGTARAALTWDVNSGDGDAITDGGGIWYVSGPGWNTGSGDALWSDGNDVVIGGGSLGSAGTIWLDWLSVPSLTFNPPNGGGNYTLSSGVLVLTPPAAITNNVGATIDSILEGSSGMLKVGTETLTLTGVNSYSGPTTITEGLVLIDGDGMLGSGNYSGDIANEGALVYSSTAGQTLSGSISGTGSITKEEASTLVFSGNNTFTGGLTISAGTVQVAGTAGTLGFGPVVMAGTTLQVNRSNASALNNDISGSGAINQLTGNTVSYGGNSTFSGSVTLNGGGFTMNGTMTGMGTGSQPGDSAVTWTVNGTLSASTLNLAPGGTGNWGSTSGTLNVNAGGVATIGTMQLSYMGWSDYGTASSTINVNGILNVTGLYGFSLGFAAHPSAINRYVNVNATGRLSATTINFSQSGANRLITLSNGTLANIPGAGLTVDSTTPVSLTGAGTIDVEAGQTATINSVVQSSGRLVKAGGGTLALPAVNTYSGATTINSGTLTLSGSGVLGSGSYAGAITNNAAFVYNSSAAQTLSGKITGTGSLTQLGSGLLTLSGGNTYSGDTVISGTATLVQSAANSLSSNSVHSLGASATLNIGNLAGSVRALAGSGTLNLAGAAANLTIANGADSTFSGVILGAGKLTKTGAGTQTLAGANSYTGGTVVNGGLLVASSTNALGVNGALTLAGGNFAYRPTVAGALNLGSGVITLTNGCLIGTTLGGTSGQSAIISSSSATATGTITVDVRGILGASVTTGTNALITAASGLTNGGATYVLGHFYNVANFKVGSLITSATAISITATSATPLASAYWKGGFSGGTNAWALSDGSAVGNWASDAAGTATPLIPGNNATVTFSATGAVNQNAMRLGANMSLAGVVMNDAGSVTLHDDGNILTLGAGGIRVNNGSGAVAFNNDILLGAAQTWTNGSANAITFAGSVANGGFALTVSGAGNMVASGTLSGSGALTKAGTGTLSFTGGSTYTGGTTISAGTLVIGGTGKLGNGNYAGAIANSAALVFSSSANQTFSGAISGAGSLTMLGSGTLTLSGANNNTGLTSVNAGTLLLLRATTVSSPTTVNSGGTLLVDNNGASWSPTIPTISLNGGTLVYYSSGNFYTVLNTGAVTNRTGASSTITISHGGGVNAAGLFLDGGLQGSGTVTVNNTRSGVGLNLRNNNTTFTGTLIVNGIASTTAGSGSGVGVGGCTTGLLNADITLNGTMELLAKGVGWANSASGAFAMGGLSGTGVMVGNHTSGGGTTVTLGNNSHNGSFGGVIANGVGNTVYLVKAGTGTQTLSGTNTYTGTTTINAGTLVVDGSLAAGSAVAVNAGGTLGGTGIVNGTVTANAGSTLAPGNGVGTLRTGGLVLNAGCTNVFGFDTVTPTNDVIEVVNNNGLTINGGLVRLYQAGTTNTFVTAGTYTLITFAGSWTGSGGLQVANPVPGLNYYFNTVDNAIKLTIVSSGTNVWTGGGGDDYWLTGGNWGGVAPVTGSLLVFDTLTRTVNSNNFTGGTTFSILFTNTAGAFNLNGNPITLVGDVVNQSAAAQTINNDLVLGSDTRNILATGAVTLNGALSAGGIVKTGTGTLLLPEGNSYSGPTTVRGGTLKINNSSGSATGSGMVTVSSNAVLGGTGAMDGPVVVNAGGVIAAGNGVGTLTAGSLTLAAGSTNIVEFSVSGSNDTVVLTSGGLTNNGCAIYLYTNGTTGAWAKTGTYTICQIAGPLGGAGLSSFSVANPAANLTYYFTTNGTALQVIIGGQPTWTGLGTDNNWTTGGNWINGTVPAPGRVLTFATKNRTMNFNTFLAGYPFGMTFAASSGSFALYGSSISLSGDVINLSTNAQVINNDLILNTGSRMVTNAAAGSVTLNGNITGSYGLAKDGTGTLTLMGLNTYTGNTTNNAGTLIIDGGSYLGGGWYSGAIVNNGAILFSSGVATQAFSGVISGVGSLTFSGGGVITYSAANTYTGGTTINAGRLVVGGGVNRMAGPVTVNNGGIVQWTMCDASDSLGAITMNPGGKMTVSVNWQWVNGNITLNGGELAASIPGESRYGNYLKNAGLFTVVGTTQSVVSAAFNIYNVNQTFNVGQTGDGSGVDLLFSGTLNHCPGVVAGWMTKTGLGTMAMASANNTIYSYTVSAGKLMFINNMSGGISGGIVNNSAVEARMDPDVSTSYGYVISGTGSFTKSGAGTLNLTVPNTYAGVTKISGGVLRLGVAGSPVSTNSTVVMAGGVLDARSYSNVLGRLTVAGNSAIWIGTNAAAVLQFSDSSATNNLWTGGLALSGVISSNSVRFGTNSAALRPDQVSLMRSEGRGVKLDDQGYVVLSQCFLLIVQ